MCSQWFKGFQEKFDKWVEEENSYPVQDSMKSNTQRSKERCQHYDFKKNQCMCTQSGLFTQVCQNVNGCLYYAETKYPIYIVPKHVTKSKKCPCCNGSTQKEFVFCTYRIDDKEVKNNLLTYRCNECKKNYIADTLYANYSRNKDIADLDVAFEKIM